MSVGSAPSELEWAAAVELLSASHRPVLACHVWPDGDALGSMLALGLALSRRGVRPVCTWGNEPLAVPARYAFLPGGELITAGDGVPAAPDVLVTLDTGSPDRLGAWEGLVGSAGACLVIDHHESNQRFGTHHLLDPSAAATAVLVAGLIDRLGVPLDQDIAVALYTGLVTDTGSFKFAATTPAVHELAARLLATGIRHDLVARAVFDTNRFGYLHLLGDALSRTVLEPAAVNGLGLVWTYTTAGDLAASGSTLDEAEGLIDVVRTTDEAEVAVVCKGDPDGTIKVSTRSKGQVDVGAVCVRLGGGGHRFAAGFTSTQDLTTTMASVRRELDLAPRLTA